MKTDYSREELISLCERAIVPVEKWSDRDSDSAHQNIGQAWAYLKAGCEFRISTEERLTTDEETIWLYFKVPTFQYFEYGDEGEGYPEEHCYIPTEKRLQERAGEDWY